MSKFKQGDRVVVIADKTNLPSSIKEGDLGTVLKVGGYNFDDGMTAVAVILDNWKSSYPFYEREIKHAN